MSLGNLLGSNITDPMLSFGCGLLVHDMVISDVVLWLDFPFWIAASVAVLVLAHHRLKLERKHGLFLISIFVLFLAVRGSIAGA